jgi:branched-chain amino acid transport system substrate-binding protein
MIDRGTFLAGLGATPIGFQGLPNYATQLSIAVVAPFSGPDRPSGEQLGNGVRAALDEYNQARFTTDKIFSIRTFDDHNDVQDALINAQFATSDPTIVAVIGHLGAKGTISALRTTYATAQMPLLVPAVTDNALTSQGYQTVFRLPTRDFDEGRLLAEYVVRSGRPKAPIVFVQDGDYGAGVAQGYVQGLGAAKISATTTTVALSSPDYDALTTAALAASPDHVTFAGNVAVLGPLLATLRARGYQGPVAACQGFFDALVVTKFAAACEGMTISSSMPYLGLAASSTQLVNDYQLRYGPLVPVAAFSYAATQIIIAAVRRTGATTRTVLARALAQVGISYSTLVGNFQFTSSGDTFDPQIYFYGVRDGKFVYIRQAHPSTFLTR